MLAGPERRRRWSVEEKLQILAQSVAPGSSVMLVCRMHGISSGQLYTWRRQFGTSGGFCAPEAAPIISAADQPAGVIEVERKRSVKAPG